MPQHTDRRSVLKTLGAGALGASVLAGTATAKEGAQVVKIPVSELADEPLVNPCNGETITDPSGTFNIVIHSHSDGNGGWHLIEEGNTQGVIAEGDQGNDYRINTGFWHEHYARPPFPVVETVTATLQAVSKGSAPNFIANLVLHLTVNANGRVTVMIDDLNMRCRG